MRWYILLLALLLVDVCQISDVAAAKGNGGWRTKKCPKTRDSAPPLHDCRRIETVEPSRPLSKPPCGRAAFSSHASVAIDRSFTCDPTNPLKRENCRTDAVRFAQILFVYRVVQKVSARLRELAPSIVTSSHNLAATFLVIPVLFSLSFGPKIHRELTQFGSAVCTSKFNCMIPVINIILL